MSSDLFETGLDIRRKVLGSDYVDRAFEAAGDDDFFRPLQEVITTIGWGAIWGRGVLDHKTRSMLTLAMVVALNRPHEVGVHLRGALRNGCTREEIRELLLHAGCYCGWPAAVDAFQVARGVFDELDAKAGGTAEGNSHTGL